MERFLVLYTGGKDSHYALWIALNILRLGEPRILIMTSSREDLYYLHTINSSWARIHAELMKIPYFVYEIRGVDEYEEIKNAIKRAVLESRARYIVSGVVSSRSQKKALDQIASEIGVEHITPLWGRDHRELLIEEVVSRGIAFVIIAAQAMGFNEEWVGREVSDQKDVEELISLSSRYQFSPVGEGGEYESYVTRSPLFEGRRIVVEGDKKWFLSGWGLMRISNIKII